MPTFVSGRSPIIVERSAHVTQQGNGVYNDCGPACVKMAALDAGVDRGETVKAMARRVDPQQDGTRPQDLEILMRELGLSPVRGDKQESPFIMLVNYQKLPSVKRGPGYTGKIKGFLHWIYVYAFGPEECSYADPLHLTAAAGLVTIPTRTLLAAEARSAAVTSRVGFIPLEKPAAPEGNASPVVETPRAISDPLDVVIRDNWATFNVRTAPDAKVSNIVGTLTRKQRLKLDAIVDVAGVKWGKATAVVDVGGAKLASAPLYLRADGFESVQVVPKPEPIMDWRHPKFLLGVSCLNDHRSGWLALENGARSVLFMDGLLEAINAAKTYKEDGALIWARNWRPHAPSPLEFAQSLGNALLDVPRNMLTTICNESDWFPVHSPESIRVRFEYEKAVCYEIWKHDPGRVMVIGEFSHGSPDVTKNEIVQVMKETYFRFASENAHRVRIGWHLYTYGIRFPTHPGTNRSLVAPEWFEGRDEMFWTQMGMPNVQHVSGETGVESGQGGFKQAQYSTDQFAEWCSWWLHYRQTRKVAMLSSCVFQFGGHSGWAGYDVRQHLGVLREFWMGTRRLPASMQIVDGEWRTIGKDVGFDPVPLDYVAPKKLMYQE